MATATLSGQDLVQQSMGAWESAVESGLKMQEQSAQWLRETFCNSAALAECYKTGQAMAGETIAKTRESIDQAIGVINQQAEASAKLVQKAHEACRNGANGDTKARCVDWWETAVDCLQMNSRAVLKANSHMLSTWSELAQKINSEATAAMSQWAQKTAEQAEKMAKAATANVSSMVNQAAGQ